MSNRKIVYLDPGHGGSDPGAINRVLHIEEADMALDVCKRAKRMLDPYVDCRLTRSDDRFLSLSERPALANAAGAHAFISYHFNSAANPNVPRSFEIYTTPGQNNSDRLATCIFDRHAALFPGQKSRTDRRDGDPDKEANFAVLRPTRCPSCLMEGEFIHTDWGARLIKDPEARERMARAVMLGVLDFFPIPERTQHEPSVGKADLPQPCINLAEIRAAAKKILQLTE